MFNVGDEVVCEHDAPITKVGDVGTVVNILPHGIRVKFHKMEREQFLLEEFTLPYSWLRLLKRGEYNSVGLKIREMYERQSYFLRHRSGQPAS